MSDVNRVMDQYFLNLPQKDQAPAPLVPIPTAKQIEVERAAASKKAELAGKAPAYQAPSPQEMYQVAAATNTGGGRAMANPVADDVRRLDPYALSKKYGASRASELIQGASNASADFTRDRYAPRRDRQAVEDSAASIVLGAATGVGNIGAWGAGLTDKDAGLYAAEKLNDFSSFVQAKQSPALNMRRRAYTAVQSNSIDENRREYDNEVAAGNGGLLTSLKRIGKDAVDSVANAAGDGTMLTEGVANGVGSIAVGGPMAKVLGRVGSLVLKGTGAGATKAGALIAQAGSKATMPGVIGAMEAGGTYSQTATEALARLAERTDISEERKRELANEAGLEAAALQFPSAAAAGIITSKFERMPFKVNSLGSAAGNLIKETIEEGIQSSTSQLATNQAMQDKIDGRQDLSEGVGEQLGLGALYGLGTAGAVQAPGAAVRGTAMAAKGTVSATVKTGKWLIGKAAERLSKVDSDIAAASPVSDQLVQARTQQLNESMAADTQAVNETLETGNYTPEVKTQVQDSLANLQRAVSLDQAEIDSAPEGVQSEIYQGVSNKFEALAKAASITLDEARNPVDRAQAGYFLATRTKQAEDLVNKIAEPLEDDDPILGKLQEYADLVTTINTNARIKASLESLTPIIQQIMAKDVQDSPQVAQSVGTLAVDNPNAVTGETAKVIAYQHDRGDIELTPTARKALDVSVAFDESRQERETLDKTQGRERTATVSAEIKTAEIPGSKGFSLVGHARNILSALNKGDQDLAREYLSDLVNFNEHMQNKVAAYNESFDLPAGQNRVSFRAWNSEKRQWFMTKPDASPYLFARKAASINTAQVAAQDAAEVNRVANRLVELFPDMGFKAVPSVELRQEARNGKASELAQSVIDDQKALNQEKADRRAAQAAQAAALDEAVEAPLSTPARTEARTSPDRTTPATSESAQSAPSEAGAEARPSTSAPAPSPAPAAEASPATQVKTPAEQALVGEQAEPEAVAAPVEAAPAVQSDDVTSVDETASSQQTGSVAYPSLLGSMFRQAFNMPDTGISRLAGVDNVQETARKALSSKENFIEFRGTDRGKKLQPDVATAYQEYLSSMVQMRTLLTVRLNKALASTNSNNRTVTENLGEGGLNVISFPQYRALNVIQEQDGKLGYNPQLLDQAMLAGLQWLLMAESRTPLMDSEKVSRMFSISETEAGQYLTQLNNGVPFSTAAAQLGKSIQNFWGVRGQKDAGVGITQGIPEGLAKEILGTMREMKLISADKVNINGQDYPQIRFNLKKESPKFVEQLNRFPTAIEDAFLVETEKKLSIGEPIEDVSRTQLRNSAVTTTRQQQQMLANEQSTPFFTNMPFLNMLQGLGSDLSRELFGFGDLEKQVLNEQHREILDSRNKQVTSAFESIFNTFGQIKDHAEDNDMSVDEVDIYYPYSITRVNRAQMDGKFNPQASKLAREVFMPSWSVLDLSGNNADHMSAFKLGIAQAMGIKVHKQSRAASVAEVDKLMKGEAFASLVQELGDLSTLSDVQSALKFDADLVKRVRLAFDPSNKAPVPPVALMALIEYARFAKGENLSEFKTPLYVEADGITDGPINALWHFATGNFTPEWLANMAKGGAFFGNKGQTNNSHTDKKDLYQTMIDAFYSTKAGHYALVDPQFGDAMDRLMAELLPDVSRDPDTGEMSFKRGLVKNPLTVKVYGSSNAGIAGKIADNLVSAIYERESEILRFLQDNGKATQADVAAMLYPASSDPVGDYRVYRAAISKLTSETFKSFDGTAKVNNNTKPGTPEYQLTANEVRNLTSNVLSIFVPPMVDAIDTVMGETTLATKTLQKATQLQSVVIEYQFLNQIEKKLAEKKATSKETGWKRADFLSESELKAIADSMKYLSPFVETGTQTMLFSGSEKVGARAEFSRNLQDQASTEGRIIGFDQAGVKAIPFLTIGSGDGQMMQNVSVIADAPTGTLKIYDGMNMKLTTIGPDSIKMNEAVHQGWMNNPLGSAYKSFESFMDNADWTFIQSDQFTLKGKDIDPRVAKTMLGLAAAVYKPSKLSLLKELVANPKMKLSVGQRATLASIEAGVKSLTKQKADELNEQFGTLAEEQEIRKRVLASVSMSVDHMAATENPFDSQGTDLTGMSQEEILSLLQARYAEESVKLRGEREQAQASVSDALPGIVDEASGVKVLETDQLIDLLRSRDAGVDRGPVVREAIRQLRDSGYRLVTGTAEANAAYAQANNLTVPDTSSVRGATVPSEKVIYLSANSMETLVHEAVHATTLTKVLAHYENPSKSSPEVADAVARLELLMDQWLDNPEFVELLNEKTRQPFLAAQSVVTDYLNDEEPTPQDKALALNEFMAWNLSNQKLIETGKRTTVMAKLARLTRDALTALRDLLFGKSAPPQVGSDLFSNIRFNTMVIMKSGNIDSNNSNVVAYQRTGAEKYTGVEQALGRMYAKFFQTVPDDQKQFARDKQSNILFESRQSLNQVRAAGYVLDGADRSVFRRVVALLSSTVESSPLALAKVGEIYQQFLDKLTVEMLMEDPESTDQNDRYVAQQKFNLLTGNVANKNDERGRSNLLPIFIGLSLTNDEFKSTLAKIELDGPDRVAGRSVDAWLTNNANAVLERVSNIYTGATGKETSLGSQMANIMESMFAQDATDQSLTDMLSQQSNKLDSFTDRMNRKVTEVMGTMASYAETKANQVKAKSTNKVVQTAASGVIALAGVMDADVAERFGEEIRQVVSEGKLPLAIKELYAEVLGRTSTNAAIYDLMKRTRQMVDNIRQQYRDYLPPAFAERFTRELTKAEWAQLHTGLGKSDIAALTDGMSVDAAVNILKGDAKQTTALVNQAQNDAVKAGATQLMLDYAEELGSFMVTRQTKLGLMPNAYAIGFLLNNNQDPSPRLVAQLDKLISLTALTKMNKSDRAAVQTLAQTETEGVRVLVSYLKGQRASEAKLTLSTEQKLNVKKGYLPTEVKDGMSLIVRSDAEYTDLTKMGYTRIGDFNEAVSRITGNKMGYYLSPVGDKAPYLQGIMRTVHDTVGGINALTMASVGPTAGTIRDLKQVNAIAKAQARGVDVGALPVFNDQGQIIRYELQMDPQMRARLSENSHLGEMIGVWHGRQQEEALAKGMNAALVNEMAAAYSKATTSEKREYINLFDDNADIDPVIKDSIKLIPFDMREQIEQAFGADAFWARKDLVNNELGYRKASIRDVWNGTTRMSEDTQKLYRDTATMVFGKKAYLYLAQAEKFVADRVSDAKVAIVVKSMVVPLANFMAAMVQLKARGLPTTKVLRGIPRKTSEIDAYVKSRIQKMDLELQLRAAAGDLVRENKLRNKIQAIQDGWRNLSIWPLLEAGEFTSITDAAISREEVNLTEGRFAEYIERATDKLPDGMKTFAKYAMVTKDTALFKGLQRSVQYGDFIAKAILYDHLRDQKNTQEQALAAITEEFVNFEYLPGRAASYWDTMGLRWFWHFKLRSAKVGLSMIRNNPVHTLLMAGLPTLPVVGELGTPATDNIFAQVVDGRVWNSLGWGNMERAMMLNPWVNVTT